MVHVCTTPRSPPQLILPLCARRIPASQWPSSPVYSTGPAGRDIPQATSLTALLAVRCPGDRPRGSRPCWVGTLSMSSQRWTWPRRSALASASTTGPRAVLWPGSYERSCDCEREMGAMLGSRHMRLLDFPLIPEHLPRLGCEFVMALQFEKGMRGRSGDVVRRH
jgi:hypothetical protein